MSWSSGLLLVVLAGAVLALPGYLLLCVLGARLPLRWGWAPPVTVLMTVVLGGAYALLGIRWGPGSAALGAAVLLGAGLLMRRAVARIERGEQRHGPPWSRPTAAMVTAATVALGLVVAAASSLRMGGLDTLNGSFDSFFHLSAIAFIREGGDASLTTALAGVYGGPTFYPVVFDALAALLPFDPVTAANAMMLAVLAALPSAVAAMVAAVSAPHRALPAAAALGAAASTLFLSTASMALVMGLWPIVLGVVCLPPGIAAVMRMPQLPRRVGGLPAAGGFALVLLGAVLAHPSNLFSFALVAGLLVLVTGVGWLRRGRLRRGLVQTGGALTAAGIAVAVSSAVLEGMHLTRPSGQPAGALLWRVLQDVPRIPVLEAPVWPLAPVWVIAGVGAVAAVRAREPAMVTAAVGAVVAVGLAMATDASHPLLEALVNPWYGARERIAPLMMCLLVILVARGMIALLDRAQGRRRTATAPLAIAVLLAAVAAGAFHPGRLPLMGSLAYTAYGLQLAPYVTPEERSFIERTAAELPEGSVVLADPRDGATLYWSLGDVETVYPTMARPQTRDQALIANYVAELDDRQQVCGALERIGPTHLYRDTSEHSGRSMNPEASAPWSGIHRIPDSSLTLVEEAGPYALYELEAPC